MPNGACEPITQTERGDAMTAHTPETYGCRYCFGIGACPKCWGRAGYDRLKAINADLLAALEGAETVLHDLAERAGDTPEWNQHGDGFVAYLKARAAIAKARGGTA